MGDTWWENTQPRREECVCVLIARLPSVCRVDGAEFWEAYAEREEFIKGVVDIGAYGGLSVEQIVTGWEILDERTRLWQHIS